ncbi:MAG: enoyl-CoA hydratase/isomerase family protein [Ferrimicrobium sp.]|jgi:enoyl-CoA hydratase|uniref:Enoyl-CoA hydratase/isomerase family protein n=1 Tax=Ferrimicrobium acidiphilum TaxID=121039 RepID=A0ABV3XZ22_9ACTN|nr:enoyl-CoA hydratase/isomerase family protein [Ferrimicrobium sp.]MCL5973193.1 enoyl-CoA hydratase/isomerase family protein [Actinomycetota bacterium]
MEEFLIREETEDNVVVLRLNRPKANALSKALLEELWTHANAMALNPPAAVVVTGSTRIFAAGAEISEFGGMAVGREMGQYFHWALNALSTLPRVVIAAIEGYALGGGLELALACDFRVAGTGAKLGQPEIALGIIPGGGGTQRLPRLIGASRAKEMILGGQAVDADRALAWGLVDRVVPDGDALATAVAWATEFAHGPLVAQSFAKRAIDGGLSTSLSEGLELEKAYFGQVFGTRDAEVGIQSFFENGPGKAQFEGR